MKYTKEQNRELCKKYPFLIPSNRWSGMRITEADNGGYWPGNLDSIPKYDYEYTELDNMPDGWRKAFGEEMCGELKSELEQAGYIDKYRITQIKEKFGTLRWYDNGNTDAGREIISKYEALSARTCICCGKPATRIGINWISPYCDDCCPDCNTVPIKDYFAGRDKGAEQW